MNAKLFCFLPVFFTRDHRAADDDKDHKKQKRAKIQIQEDEEDGGA